MSNKARILMVHSNSKQDVRVIKEAQALMISEVSASLSILYWARNSESEGPLTIDDQVVPTIIYSKSAKFGVGAVKNLQVRLGFMWFVMKYLVHNRNTYDIVHVVNFELAFVVYMSKFFVHSKKYVYDIFDYILDGYGANLPKLLKYIIYFINKTIMRKFDLTIFASEDRLTQVPADVAKRIVVVENAPNYTSVPTSGKVQINSHTKINIVYVGVLADNRYLVEVAEIVSDKSEFELYIGGFGKLEGAITEIANRANNVHFLGSMEYKDVLYLENQADLLLALYSLTIPNHKYAAPNKFYESLFLGKPVLMVEGSGMSKFVSQYDLGVLAKDSKSGIRDALEKFSKNRNHYELSAQGGKHVYKDYFSWDIMSTRLVDAYKEIGLEGVRN